MPNTFKEGDIVIARSIKHPTMGIDLQNVKVEILQVLDSGGCSYYVEYMWDGLSRRREMKSSELIPNCFSSKSI